MRVKLLSSKSVSECCQDLYGNLRQRRGKRRRQDISEPPPASQLFPRLLLCGIINSCKRSFRSCAAALKSKATVCVWIPTDFQLVPAFPSPCFASPKLLEDSIPLVFTSASLKCVRKQEPVPNSRDKVELVQSTGWTPSGLPPCP